MNLSTFANQREEGEKREGKQLCLFHAGTDKGKKSGKPDRNFYQKGRKKEEEAAALGPLLHQLDGEKEKREKRARPS